MNDSIRRIHGSCHCGNIRFTFDWSGGDGKIPVRAFGCDMCTKHRGVWTSNSRGQFDMTVEDESEVSRYRFGTKTADFHVCRVCGVVPIVTCAIDGRD